MIHPHTGNAPARQPDTHTPTCTKSTHNAHMAPKGPRADARARADEAFRLRCRGHTWQEIADKLGFKSRSSATLAVKRLILRDPPEDAVTARTYTGHAYRQVTATLFESLEAAKTAGDHTAVATIGRAIGEIQEKHAKLTGLHIPVVQQKEVEVNVQINTTAAAVIDQAEHDLLAIAAGTKDAGLLPVIDAEVVEVP